MMNNEKNYSDEMLKKYISSEVSKIEEEKKEKENWQLNKNFHSQITIRKEGE